MVVFRRCSCGPKTIVLYECEGREIGVTAGGRGVRFLFISGKPLNEPIAWYGPIVLKTQEELPIGFEDHEKGFWIKRR